MTIAYRWVVTLTAVLAVVFTVSGWAVEGIEVDRIGRELALVALNTLPLLGLRANPLAVVAVLSVAYPLWVGFGHPTHELQSLPSLAAMFALGAWDRPLWVRALGVLLPVWMVGAAAAGLWDVSWIDLSYVGLVFLVVWALGVLVAARRSYADALEARTAELERAREQLAERAVADERARIARELHDVIAHAMSVITVQAGVGAHLLERDPSKAAGALMVIERTGREALEEMRRMLAILREPSGGAGSTPNGPPSLDPQPGLSELPHLVEQNREGGLELAFTTVGRSRPLPAGLELAAYRVVQEALTNVLKHAPGSRAAVRVVFLPEALEVEVRNGETSDPADADAPRAAAGQGLRGMAERVALYGGRLETVGGDRGFRVLASFPLTEAP